MQHTGRKIFFRRRVADSLIFMTLYSQSGTRGRMACQTSLSWQYTVALRGYHSDSRLLRLAAASLSARSDRQLEVKLRKPMLSSEETHQMIRWLSDSEDSNRTSEE